MAFLYEKIDVLRENGYISNIPSYIPTNLNSAFELRPYQKTAFENFITHFESSKCPRPTQLCYCKQGSCKSSYLQIQCT